MSEQDYPNIRAMAAGTIAGAWREWPRVQPEAKALLAALEQAQKLIVALETQCDPSGDLRNLILTRFENAMLRAALAAERAAHHDAAAQWQEEARLRREAQGEAFDARHAFEASVREAEALHAEVERLRGDYETSHACRLQAEEALERAEAALRAQQDANAKLHEALSPKEWPQAWPRLLDEILAIGRRALSDAALRDTAPARHYKLLPEEAAKCRCENCIKDYPDLAFHCLCPAGLHMPACACACHEQDAADRRMRHEVDR